MKKSTMAMAIALAIGMSVSAKADERTWKWSPVGIGLAAPVQVPFIETDVYGLRIDGLFGYNHDVYGLDCGLAAVCSGTFRGCQVSAFSWTDGDAYGLQLAPLATVVRGRTCAVQLAFANAVWEDAVGAQLGIANYTTDMRGVQFAGIINWNNLASYGLQFALVNANQMEYYGWAFAGLVNYADSFNGFACGLVNVAYDMRGCQLGLFNACDHMNGVQLGLINLICGSRLPIMTLVNAWF